ncbi:uncharacterized protein [Euphorbia lathyris]|uniref:uncharacterized protein n=1 Tax=Euphorbia lathyris TaxID=212925 RepID=UPI00331435FB
MVSRATTDPSMSDSIPLQTTVGTQSEFIQPAVSAVSLSNRSNGTAAAGIFSAAMPAAASAGGDHSAAGTEFTIATASASSLQPSSGWRFESPFTTPEQSTVTSSYLFDNKDSGAIPRNRQNQAAPSLFPPPGNHSQPIIRPGFGPPPSYHSSQIPSSLHTHSSDSFISNPGPTFNPHSNHDYPSSSINPVYSNSTTNAINMTRPAPTHTATHIKLTPHNYKAWRMAIVSTLKSHHYFEHIISNNAPPPKFQTRSSFMSGPDNMMLNPAYTVWDDLENTVMSLLLHSLTEEIYPLITCFHYSHDIWVALEQAYGIITDSRQFQLSIKLQELEQNDMPITEYMHKLKDLLDDLAASGNPYPMHLLPPLLYKNVGEAFKSTIQNLITQKGIHISFYELLSNLKMVEGLIQSTAKKAEFILPTPRANSLEAHVSTVSPNGTAKKNKKRRGGKCFNCGDLDHWADKCKRPKGYATQYRPGP